MGRRIIKPKKEHKTNDEVRVPELRLTGEGFQSYICTIEEALSKSEEMGLDLVLMNETSKPPICKIMNYEKFIYERNKAKKKQKTLDVKEIRLTPNTGDNDLEYRTKHIIEFLEKGHKVKIVIKFRGREMANTNRGQEVLLKLAVAVEEFGVPETLPKLEGKRMFILLKPKPKTKK